MGSQLGGLIGGLWGDAGQNFVDLQGGDDAVFGTKPKVADFTPLDLMAEQKKAIDANTANAGDLDKLLDSIMPGYSDMLKQGSSNAMSLLRGEIPQDVQDQVKRSSAYQALIGGYAGSGMSRALTARDLGRTSLDMMQLGQNSAQSWARSAMEQASPWEITTSLQAGTTAGNNAGQQAHDQMVYNVAAAPDPGAAGVFNLDAALGQQMLQLGGSMGGMAMAGGGGSPSRPSQPASNTGQNTNSGIGNWWSGLFSSDERLKENVATIGTSPQGHRIVEFNYLGSRSRFRGVIAQEAQKIAREAVCEDVSGYLMVDYSKIDVPFEPVTT